MARASVFIEDINPANSTAFLIASSLLPPPLICFGRLGTDSNSEGLDDSQ